MCKNISISTASLKTRAQRFPETDVISLYFTSLGISFSQFSLWLSGLYLLICWNSAYSWLYLLQLQGTVEASACCFNISQQVLCTVLWGKMKILHFSFLSEPQDGALSPGQTVKNTSPQITKIFYSVNMLLWSPHLQRFLSGRDSALPINQLRWIIIQCCVMVAYWGQSSRGRECWQLCPEQPLLSPAVQSHSYRPVQGPYRNRAGENRHKTSALDIWFKYNISCNFFHAEIRWLEGYLKGKGKDCKIKELSNLMGSQEVINLEILSASWFPQPRKNGRYCVKAECLVQTW